MPKAGIKLYDIVDLSLVKQEQRGRVRKQWCCTNNAVQFDSRLTDPFPKRHRLVHNGGFTKFEALYGSLNMVNSAEVS